MLEFLTNPDDAIHILKSDHDKVKGLFDQFEKADNMRQKKKIVAGVIMELKIHAEIEEKIFYPALRRNKVDKDILNEADEEHHVAKLLIAELEQVDSSNDHYDAKFTVLSENIRHHIREEESDMFTQARRTDIDFIAVGQQMLALKKLLKKNGVPVCSEEKMVFRNKGRADSPASAARAAKAKGKGAAAKRLPPKAASPVKKPAKATQKAPARQARGRR